MNTRQWICVTNHKCVAMLHRVVSPNSSLMCSIYINNMYIINDIITIIPFLFSPPLYLCCPIGQLAQTILLLKSICDL